jgi:hypothetical protein
MQWTVTTWNEFRDVWDGVHNFLMRDECVPFTFSMPPIERVVEELRHDEDARIGSGTKGPALLLDDTAEKFRRLPLEQALKVPFTLAHFSLSRFDAPGRFLHGFKDQVLDPWQRALRGAGFTFERCYPIIFISGINCASNYHMDFSHVVAWQIYGSKHFCGLKAPGRWAPWRARVNYQAGALERPAELTEDDILDYDMKPGDVLWNALLTPHWVDAGDEIAMSVNLSHGGIRLDGRLCPFEQELEDFRAAHPGAPARVQGNY